MQIMAERLRRGRNADAITYLTTVGELRVKIRFAGAGRNDPSPGAAIDANGAAIIL